MMLAWAWRGFFIELLWEHLQGAGWMVLLYRVLFALFFTLLLAFVITKLNDKIEEQKAAGDDHTYMTVAMHLLSAAFGLFIAWCWNQVSESLGEAISDGAAATALSTLMWAIGVTAAASIITVEISVRLKAFAESTASEESKPVYLKFVDLVMVALGYVVGWAWSDAVTHILIEYFAFSDMKVLYLVYSIGVTVAR